MAKSVPKLPVKKPSRTPAVIERKFAEWNRSLSAYLDRRPHRSFRRTYIRDYARSFALPGYIGLTKDTFVLLVRNWKLFGTFFLVAAIVASVALGVVSQETYSSISEALKSTDVDIWTRSFAIFGSAISGNLGSTGDNNGKIVAGIFVLLAWLTMVWLLRHVVAGKQVKMREGIYNSGAPIIPTSMVALAGLVQSIPLIAVAIGYSAAKNTGLLNGGIEAMLFYAAAGLLVLLSSYWLTSTFIALIIVTLPGIYPMAALRAAGDLVVGRRVRLLLRLLWITAAVSIIWSVILYPTIVIDNWLGLTWLPLVPVMVLALGILSIIVLSTYIYLLYRKLVEDGAEPA